MRVRSEQSADHEAIGSVHTASFSTAGEAELVDALRAARRLCVSLVAEENGEIIGHIACSPVSVLGAADGVGLAPLAVLPAFRRHGVGEQLVRRGLAECERLRHGFVVILGAPRYYRRFGFTPAYQWGLCDEYRGGEAFQVVELRPGAIPRDAGIVRYAPEFAVLGGGDAAS